jgi:hypothetical protein
MFNHRGVIRSEDVLCPLCATAIETSGHVFLHCRFAAEVWYMLSRWLGMTTVLPPNVLSSYVMLVGYGSNKKQRKVFSIAWLAFVWALWKSRNQWRSQDFEKACAKILTVGGKFFFSRVFDLVNVRIISTSLSDFNISRSL